MSIYEKLNSTYYSTDKYIINLEKSNSTDKNENILKNVTLNKNYIVADFGCGIGSLFENLEGRIDKYYGIDYSSVLIEHARKKFSNYLNKRVFFFDEEITEFCKFFNNSFDVAFALDFIEHLYDDDVISIFSSIRNTLKEDGKIVIHTPNGNFFLEILKNRKIIKQLPSHIAVRNLKKLKELLIKAGFKEIKVTVLSHWNILKNIHFLSFIPLIGKFFEARLLIECKK